MISERIFQLRTSKKMSQEALASKLGISRQSIQKWEANEAQPTIDKLLSLSDIFNVSIDYLCSGRKDLGDDAGRVGNEILPDYNKWHFWESYAKMLPIEYRQSFEEGKDIAQYEQLFHIVSKMRDSKYKDKIADVLFDIVNEATIRSDYRYYEPNDLTLIRKSIDGFNLQLTVPADDILQDKITGGWYGRICGCLLGKPVEGINRNELLTILKRSGNYPLHKYIDKESITDEVAKGISFPISERTFSSNICKMPIDDDTNYTIMGYEIIKNYGRTFTSENVAEMWLKTQVKNMYCTAERVAYRNFVNGYLPPASAEYKNAFREWIGAQIRGDFYGYFNPCAPAEAADMAYRDACISHVKNGIYGEMWVSAMIATAFGCNTIEDVIRRGLAEIPYSSRLYTAISRIIEMYNSGTSQSDCFADIHSRWVETNSHDWCHTISNAEIVAASLLYGKGSYGNSICITVEQGFDTDCNGATVGSILGVMIGYRNLPEEWTCRINDTLESGISGYSSVSVKELAANTFNLLKKA